MLLLVPANKSEDREGNSNGGNSADGNAIGVGTSGGAKVMVVLPRDTDLTSKNVLLPEIPKSPLDTDNSSGHHRHHRFRRRSSATLAQDHLSIFQPTAEPNQTRGRHHSSDHGYDPTEFSCSSSRHHPFHHMSRNTKPPRTPRSLRSAFRKSRPDPSPLLTPALFGIDALEDVDVYDSELLQSLRERHSATSRINSMGVSNSWPATSGYSSSHTSITTSSTPSLTSSSTDRSSPSTASVSSSFAVQGIMGPSSFAIPPPGTTTTARLSLRRKPGSKTLIDGDDTESLEDDGEDEGDVREKEKGLPEEQMDVDDAPRQRDTRDSSTAKQRENDTLESDLDIILGMASDMELIMPKFDDVYLADLDDNPPIVTRPSISSRRIHQDGAKELPQPCSKSSTTIISPVPTLRSRTLSPHIGSASPTTAPSPLTAAAAATAATAATISTNPTIAMTRETMSDRGGSEGEGSTNKIDPMTISRDIDNLRRHRDSLKDINDKGKVNGDDHGKDVSTSATKSSGPIYFKPSAHTLPIGPIDNSLVSPPPPLPTSLPLYPSLPVGATAGTTVRGSVPPIARPAPMIIQSSQWRGTNGHNGIIPAIEPGSNLIYSIRDAVPPPSQSPLVSTIGGSVLPTTPGLSIVPIHPLAPLMIVPPPPALHTTIPLPLEQHQQPQLPSPPPVTAQQISMATANMTIPSPLELQEEYHYKRDLKKKYYQQLRRTSAMLERSIGGVSVTASSSSRRSSTGSANTTPTTAMPSLSQSFGSGSSSASIHLLQVEEGPYDKPNRATTAPGPSPPPPAPVISAAANGLPSHLASYYMPPSVFRTAADVEAEEEAERERKEEEMKDSFFNLPSPTPSELQQHQQQKTLSLSTKSSPHKSETKDSAEAATTQYGRNNGEGGLGVHAQQQQQQQHDIKTESAPSSRNESISSTPILPPRKLDTGIHPLDQKGLVSAIGASEGGMEWENPPLPPPLSSSSSTPLIRSVPVVAVEPESRSVHPLSSNSIARVSQSLPSPLSLPASTTMTAAPSSPPFQRALPLHMSLHHHFAQPAPTISSTPSVTCTQTTQPLQPPPSSSSSPAGVNRPLPTYHADAISGLVSRPWATVRSLCNQPLQQSCHRSAPPTSASVSVIPSTVVEAGTLGPEPSGFHEHLSAMSPPPQTQRMLSSCSTPVEGRSTATATTAAEGGKSDDNSSILTPDSGTEGEV